jgi:AraC-like DNA-binding protein
MHILLTGTTGYVGSRLARFLVSQGYAVTRERTLLEAKRLLHFTDLSVKEIAFELGFGDPAYFTAFLNAPST